MANEDLLEMDEKEPRKALPAVVKQESKTGGDTTGNADISAILPSQVLMMIMEKVRTTIMLVGWFYSGLVFLLCAAAVILLAPEFIWLSDKSSPVLMNFARLAVSLVAIVVGLGSLVVLVKAGQLKGNLVEAEGLIDNIRDQAFLQIQATRYNLEDLTEMLEFPKEKQSPSPLDYIDVAKKLGPLLSLWNSKERSLVTLGVEGLKFYQSLKKILNR